MDQLVSSGHPLLVFDKYIQFQAQYKSHMTVTVNERYVQSKCRLTNRFLSVTASLPESTDVALKIMSNPGNEVRSNFDPRLSLYVFWGSSRRQPDYHPLGLWTGGDHLVVVVTGLIQPIHHASVSQP